MRSALIKVGLCGFGTVGKGVFELMTASESLIADRAGSKLEVVHVGCRRPVHGISDKKIRVSTNIFDVAIDPTLDIVIEVIGGTTTAKELITAALNEKKHVVTANKALLAVHGNTLFALAEKQGVNLKYEAAVAGGIPIIKTLREALAANSIRAIVGIINGTSNFILSKMASSERVFAETLAEAQVLGYAESDPSFDIDGSDAAQKLAIMASLAFGMPIEMNGFFQEGIESIESEDFQHAADLGYRIKHLGIARLIDDRIETRVHPTLIPASLVIAQVDGVLNAVMVETSGVGELLLVGPGAGSSPTASAICADVLDIARGIVARSKLIEAALGVPTAKLVSRDRVAVADMQSAWYLRVLVSDVPLAVASAADVLKNMGITIGVLKQKAPEPGAVVASLIITTGVVSTKRLTTAVAEMEALDSVVADVVLLRIEAFE